MKLAIAILLGVFIAAAAHAEPRFDVVSIKLASPETRNSGFRRASPGALRATNVTLKMLIEHAYDVRDYQISGGPSWLDTARYEILAKSDAATPEAPSVTRLRIQAMLADRFHLSLHHVTRELPNFTLVLARNGPKNLKPSTDNEPDLITNGHHITCRKTTLDMFCKLLLQGELRRPVINKTGIEGEFDFALDWLPDPKPGAEPSPNPDGPSFFTALQEQLGLKLETTKGPVDVLVIERAEPPTEN